MDHILNDMVMIEIKIDIKEAPNPNATRAFTTSLSSTLNLSKK